MKTNLFAELPLVVDLFLHWRVIGRLGLWLLRLLLLRSPPYHRPGLDAVILRLLVLGMYSVRSAYGHGRLSHRVCFRPTNLWRCQGRLSDKVMSTYAIML